MQQAGANRRGNNAAAVLAPRLTEKTSASASGAAGGSPQAPGSAVAAARHAARQRSKLWRWRLHVWRTFEDPTYSPTAKQLTYFIILTIVVSIVNFAIASYPTDLCEWQWACSDGSLGCTFSGTVERECAAERVESYDWSAQIEAVCIMVFTAELVIRLSCCSTVMNPLYFFTYPFNVLDVVAIAPWYVVRILTLILGASPSGSLQKIFGVVRIVRLTRVLRIFKVSKNMKMMMVLFTTLHRSLNVLMLLLMMVMILMLGFGAFLFLFEQGTWNPHLQQYVRPDGAQSPYRGIPDAMYWCMATMTTVGYGDLYPITTPGWLVGIATMMAGTVILSLPITVIGATFSDEYMEQERIAQREKRLQQHNEKLGLIGPAASRGVVRQLTRRISKRFSARHSSRNSARNSAVAKAGDYSADSDGAASPSASAPAGAPPAAVKPKGTFAAKLAGRSSSDGAPAVEPPLAGMMECEWLIEEFRDACTSDMKGLLAKGEQDLMRMTRKVLIHSRVFGSQQDRSMELPPGGLDALKELNRTLSAPSFTAADADVVRLRR